MSTPDQITLKISDKPNLKKAMAESPDLAREVIAACVKLMDEAFDPHKGIQWAHLPKLLNKNLNFYTLVRGILRGALDVKDMDPEAFDAIKVEVHPLAMLSPRKSVVDPGKVRMHNWRAHWRIDDENVTEDTVAEIVRKMFRYTRWINIDEFAKAYDSAQVASYKGLGHIAIQNMPFVPALKYQQKHFGDLHVGKRIDETGFFDCGSVDVYPHDCPACATSWTSEDADNSIHHAGYIGCLSCNAGFKV